MWTTVIGYILKRLPQILGVLAIAAVVTWMVWSIQEHGFQRGYDQRWSETLPKEIRDDYARAKLADDAYWRTTVADFTMLVSAVVRENAYARYLAQSAAVTDGLADRVRDYENRLRAGSVSQGGTCDGASTGGSEGAEGSGRLRDLQQAVYTACGRDGAALMTLRERPVCECSTGERK